jgi:chromate transporter
LREALLYWLKLGLISFGGPTAQIAMMHQELVEKKRWISEKRFLHALNYCMLLPGPEAQQLATYLGWLMHRTWGGILAGVFFILPSLFILIALSWIYITYGQTPIFAAIFFGIKPAVTAIVLQAAHRIAKRSIRHALLWSVAAASFIAIFVFNLPFPLIIISAGLFGLWGGKKYPEIFKPGGHKNQSSQIIAPAIIDDDTPIPPHALFSKQKLFWQIGIGFILWLAPMVLLIALYNWKSLYPQIAWFFTKAALLTFGGAYAVLPYVYQGAVEHFHWLSPGQMMDGLALGETTPGPLIMIVTYVGYLAGHLQHAVGGNLGFWGGVIGACVATWFTFLPSFLFILFGAPFIESTHGNLKLTAPLTAITAAVVGVIANLAIFFAYHVFFPSGISGAISWLSIAIAIASAIALMRYQIGIIPVIACTGLIGLSTVFF